MVVANQKMVTVGEVAELLGVPHYRIQYFIKTRNIKPIQRAGILRLFTLDQVEMMRDEFSGSEVNSDVPEVPGHAVM